MITMLEEGNFCDYFYKNDDDGLDFLNITGSSCKTLDGGIATTGVTNIFQTIYKLSSQLMINFRTLKQQYSTIPPADVVANFKTLVVPFDVVETILDKPLKMLNDAEYSSIIKYFKKNKTNFVIIYTIFIILTFILLITFMASKICQLIDSIYRYIQKTED